MLIREGNTGNPNVFSFVPSHFHSLRNSAAAYSFLLFPFTLVIPNEVEISFQAD